MHDRDDIEKCMVLRAISPFKSDECTNQAEEQLIACYEIYVKKKNRFSKLLESCFLF